jgi:glutathione S-transferase
VAYELYYWPGLQGRGEFIRLALEDSGADYVDVARRSGKDRGMPALLRGLKNGSEPHSPFAPPYLKDGDWVLSQVANILMYLGPKIGLAPEDEGLRFIANGVQLTIADMVGEVHDSHHPIASALYYEDQKKEAKARSASFIKDRIPKFMRHFEHLVSHNPDGRGETVGASISYVDLSLFQLMEGLAYAFPRALKKFDANYPHLANLRESVRARPNIARYLASERRIPFNETGIFRHYPELDQEPG